MPEVTKNSVNLPKIIFSRNTLKIQLLTPIYATKLILTNKKLYSQKTLKLDDRNNDHYGIIDKILKYK